jgi:hypothetical protein
MSCLSEDERQQVKRKLERNLNSQGAPEAFPLGSPNINFPLLSFLNKLHTHTEIINKHFSISAK